MKKLLTICSLSLSLGLLLVCGIAYANQTNMSTYYPSPSGTYTKVHLINQSGGPNENSSTTPFCLQTSASTYDSVPTSGHTYINAGTIFADSTTGYLEICKSDGTVATYPGSCFNRFGTVVANPPCPTNYHQSGGSSSMSNNAVSWTCCFTGGLTTTATQSGCFSLYSTTSPAPYCSTVNSNAYDIGCAYVGSFYKRDCCYNDSAGSLTPTICNGGCEPVNGSCTACSSTCQNIAGTCTASTQPTCGGSSAVGTTCYGSGATTNATCGQWSSPCTQPCGGGTMSCLASNNDQKCGGSNNVVGTTMACDEQSCNGTGNNGNCACGGTWPNCSSCGSPPSSPPYNPPCTESCDGSCDSCDQCDCTGECDGGCNSCDEDGNCCDDVSQSCDGLCDSCTGCDDNGNCNCYSEGGCDTSQSQTSYTCDYMRGLVCPIGDDDDSGNCTVPCVCQTGSYRDGDGCYCDTANGWKCGPNSPDGVVCGACSCYVNTGCPVFPNTSSEGSYGCEGPWNNNVWCDSCPCGN